MAECILHSAIIVVRYWDKRTVSVSSLVEGEKLVRIDLSPFGVPLARRTIAPLVPKAGVAAMPTTVGVY